MTSQKWAYINGIIAAIYSELFHIQSHHIHYNFILNAQFKTEFITSKKC